MTPISPCDEERAEVGAVLQSGIFLRAPNLENFFRYICDRSLEGEADQLKEYSVAVEALGRAPEFDAKKDSIVRVEAHRLRKRLDWYYAGPGADHRIHVTVPRGSYAPQFVRIEPEAVSVVPAVPAHPPIDLVQPPSIPARGRRLRWALAAILIAVPFVIWRSVLAANASAASELWKPVSGEVVPAEFRMLAGYHGRPFTDSRGREWWTDSYYSGGQSVSLSKRQALEGLPYSSFLRSARTGTFSYDIPVRAGIFEVHLYFAETEFGTGNPKGGGDGSRTFRLAINGKQQIGLFDVHAQAGGPNRVFVRVFKDVSRSSNGKIRIAFDPVGGYAFVNAIEILPAAAGRIRPVRIVAQDHSVTDSDGQVWSADEYFVGGTLVLRHEARFQQRNSALYQGERFGNFTYHIPLAPGKYRATLHFAETWFGTADAAAYEPEHRLFDIYANGVALVRSLDVLREAGAPNRAIEKVFEDLQPNAQGELTLQFIPLVNYAEVNAIEMIETE